MRSRFHLAFQVAAILGLFLAVPLVGPGCCVPNKAFVAGIDSATEAIVPEYLRYVEADSALSAEEKATRQRTCDLLRSTIAEAKGEAP